MQGFRDKYQSKMQQLQNFQLGGPEKLLGADDPRHTLQGSGGSADFRYVCDVINTVSGTTHVPRKRLKLKSMCQDSTDCVRLEHVVSEKAIVVIAVCIHRFPE